MKYKAYFRIVLRHQFLEQWLLSQLACHGNSSIANSKPDYFLENTEIVNQKNESCPRGYEPAWQPLINVIDKQHRNVPEVYKRWSDIKYPSL